MKNKLKFVEIAVNSLSHLSSTIHVIDILVVVICRGSYMSAHVLLNLLNKLGKKKKCEACRAFCLFFPTSLINSIMQEHEC